MSRDEISNGSTVEKAQPFFLWLSYFCAPPVTFVLWLPSLAATAVPHVTSIHYYPEKWIIFPSRFQQNLKNASFPEALARANFRTLQAFFFPYLFLFFFFFKHISKKGTVTAFLALAWEPMVCCSLWFSKAFCLSCRYQEFPGVEFAKPWGSPSCYWLRLWRVERRGWLLYPKKGHGPWSAVWQEEERAAGVPHEQSLTVGQWGICQSFYSPYKHPECLMPEGAWH